jgi:hypothetical protein
MLSRSRLGFVVALGSCLLVPLAAAANECTVVHPPDSKVLGKTLGEWHAEWWKWAISIHPDRHPFKDLTGQDCGMGQKPPVFFLAGATGSGEVPPIVRTECRVPAGSYLYMPILNVVGWDFSEPDAEAVRTELENFLDQASLLECEIDGCAVPDLRDYRNVSDVFEWTIPDPNILGAAPGTFLAIAGGFCLMMDPLAAGERRTIHYKSAFGNPPTFSLDITFVLNGEEDTSGFRRGDSNGDGGLNVTDAVNTLEHLFRGGAPPPCPDAADADDSGRLNVTDPVYLLEHLFRGGSAPPAPGPAACGEDPTQDDLTGCSSSC